MAFHEMPWYDRNPKSIWIVYEELVVAPHGYASRWEYTVPNDKVAFVEFLFLKVLREDAPSPARRAGNLVNMTYKGIGTKLVEAAIYDTDVGANDSETVSLMLTEGQTITALSYDFSTGGTVDHWIIAKIIEFDAYKQVDVQRAHVRPDPVM